MADLISKDVAEVEFNRFADVMDIDINEGEMTEADRESFQDPKNKIIKSIIKGDLVINEAGEPVFTPKRSKSKEPITFHEPTGATMMVMDRKKKSEDVSKMYSAMGDMAKVHEKTFAMMAMGDLKVCMAVTTLFLA